MEKNYSFKHIYKRKLKSGDWVVLAADSDLLVVDEADAMSLTKNDSSMDKYDDETLQLLRESGFFLETHYSNQHIPEEKSNLRWRIMRYGLVFMGMICIFAMIIVTPIISIPIGYDVIPDNVPLWETVVFIVLISLSTTFLHECMHMIYARTKIGGLRLHINKAIAVVPMTHIWVWSFFSRLSALAAGIISDLFLLTFLTCAQLFLDSWMLVTASSILWIRILWQFGFHRKCDGQLIAMTVIDNPTIFVDATNTKKELTKNKDTQLWKRLRMVGYVVDALLFAFWLIPFIMRIVDSLKLHIF